MQNLHLGTIGWSYNFWKGSFYPARTASENFLAYYATRFDTVEVDNTFYRIPNREAVERWKDQTPQNFTFSLKFPGIITHVKRLKDCRRETDLFLERAVLLGEKLGPLLLQFPPDFGVEHLGDLAGFLHKLPKPNRYVVEVRDKDFFTEDFFSVLKSNNVALAWVDRPGTPELEIMTSDFLYVRWEGDRKKVKGIIGKIENDTRESLAAWTERIKPYLRRGLPLFGYFGKYYSGYPPSDVDLLSKFLE